jgi:predicted ferric reductase
MTPKTTLIHPIASTVRNLSAACVIFLVVALFAGVLTIPFLFESPSMYYKTGWDKTLLRAGKMVGLTAALFILLQLPLAARLKWLDRIFSLPTLYTLHRYGAYALAALAIAHPILVLVPDGMLMIPLEARYWPEWAGAAMLVVILLQVGACQWRKVVFKRYQGWLLFHRIMGPLAIGLLIVHILYVSETFEDEGLPRNLAFAAAAVSVGLWLWFRLQRISIRYRPLTVTDIKPAGENAYAIDMELERRQPLHFLPGQFGFLSFDSKQVSNEPHPFTLSSTPSRPDNLQVTIRRCGDWTRKAHLLQKGDRAYIQGPFGRFGHLFFPFGRDIIMIAGGIGITPMLSMLRYMYDVDDQRRILLIWSNQTPQHLFNEAELTLMEQKLTGFRWIPIFTRENGDDEHFGRLDRDKLRYMLDAYDRSAIVFLCGPPKMIRSVRSDLKALGFHHKSIQLESFGL